MFITTLPTDLSESGIFFMEKLLSAYSLSSVVIGPLRFPVTLESVLIHHILGNWFMFSVVVVFFFLALHSFMFFLNSYNSQSYVSFIFRLISNFILIL